MRGLIRLLVYYGGNYNQFSSFSEKKDPINSKKQTEISSNKTIFASDLLIIATSCAEAITKNAITNAIIALRFFFAVFTPSTSSVPNIFVFSNIANTIVNTRINGSITSYTPSLSKN